MKSLKVLLIAVLLCFVVFLIYRKSDEINLEGNWKTTKLVINGTDLIASHKINEYFDIGNVVLFNYWNDTLYITTTGEEVISAKFEIDNDSKKSNKIKLSSKEIGLNGNFIMQVDTTHVGPQAYVVFVKLYLNKTHLHFQRNVVIPPWKPEFPRKGQV